MSPFASRKPPRFHSSRRFSWSVHVSPLTSPLRTRRRRADGAGADHHLDGVGTDAAVGGHLQRLHGAPARAELRRSDSGLGPHRRRRQQPLATPLWHRRRHGAPGRGLGRPPARRLPGRVGDRRPVCDPGHHRAPGPRAGAPPLLLRRHRAGRHALHRRPPGRLRSGVGHHRSRHGEPPRRRRPDRDRALRPRQPGRLPRVAEGLLDLRRARLLGRADHGREPVRR